MPDSDAQKSVATGTDGGTTLAPLTKTSDFLKNCLAPNGTASERKTSAGEAKGGSSKLSEISKLDTNSPLLSADDAGKKTNGRYRTRTCDPLIKSQLLYQLS